MPIDHGKLFQREVECVRLRAMLAIQRTARDPDLVVADRLAADLDALEAAMADDRAHGRARELAARLALDEDDLELLWTAVAATADPHLLPHLQVLGGGEARRGLSLALHVLVADVDHDGARALAHRVHDGHPLLAHHL
ncbi:MAG: hypothetical protein KIT31_39705, partial [Deltaproteobacteria bacterium]|nr:hypothetical protein [Deltaproteobacteria bacterium]